jgi:hypothetical protein
MLLLYQRQIGPKPDIDAEHPSVHDKVDHLDDRHDF